MVVVLDEVADLVKRRARDKHRAQPVMDEPAGRADLAPRRIPRFKRQHDGLSSLQLSEGLGAARLGDFVHVQKCIRPDHLFVDALFRCDDVSGVGLRRLGRELGAQDPRRMPGQNLEADEKYRLHAQQETLHGSSEPARHTRVRSGSYPYDYAAIRQVYYKRVRGATFAL